MFDSALTLKSAEMYYYHRLSQKDIAAKLGLSVPTVSRMLNDALVSGMIKVEIVDKERHIDELEEKMATRFELQGATVISLSPSANPASLKKLLGKAASSILYDQVKPGHLVGMGPGETMLELVESLDPGRTLPGLTLLPLMGGWGFGGMAYEVNRLLGNAANSLRCDFNLMPCPALTSSEEVREIFLREPIIAEIAAKWERLDMALVSIGGEVDDAHYPQLASGNATSLAQAKRSGAVGDILGRFIGAEGSELDLEINRRFVSIPAETLARVPLRIGIGGGSAKIRSIRASLKRGLINYLVSDESTCGTILQMED